MLTLFSAHTSPTAHRHLQFTAYVHMRYDRPYGLSSQGYKKKIRSFFGFLFIVMFWTFAIVTERKESVSSLRPHPFLLHFKLSSRLECTLSSFVLHKTHDWDVFKDGAIIFVFGEASLRTSHRWPFLLGCARPPHARWCHTWLVGVMIRPASHKHDICLAYDLI